MSKVLLIEPDKMLRQAFMVALFPEFQIQAVEAIPDTAPDDFDALIVDAAALQERAPKSARMIRVVTGWHLPIIWIDGDQPGPASDPAQCIRLKRPVAKEALRRALAQCLSPSAAPKSTVSAEPVKTPLGKKTRTKKAVDIAAGGNRIFIELVDVVEEDAAR
jgi:hypothetical protein